MFAPSMDGQCVLPVSFQTPVFRSNHFFPLSGKKNQEGGGVIHQLAACLIIVVPCFCMGEQFLSWRSSLGVMSSLRCLGCCSGSPPCKATDPIGAGSK